MDCFAVTGALGVFIQPEAGVEAQLDQVGNMTGLGVRGGVGCGQDGANNAEGGGLFLFERRVLDAVGFKMTGEASVQPGAGLGIWRLSRAREAIQEVGLQNCPHA